MNCKTISIPILKSKANVKMKITPSKNVLKWLKKLQPELTIIFEKLKDNDLLYKTSREHMTCRLNKFLKIHSLQYSKNVTSHSFRITIITNIIEHCGIETAKEVVGHASISSTQLYNRSNLNSNTQKQIFDKINPIQFLDEK